MGTYSFNDFYTNPTAMIVKAGESAAEEFHTLFGTGGSNQLTGSSDTFDLANLTAFDDVIEIQHIGYEGEILSSNLSVTFSTRKVLAPTRTSLIILLDSKSSRFFPAAMLSNSKAETLASASLQPPLSTL